jgi:hypothetical protein
MKYPEDVQKLAETLKNSGLAASMTDALERASMMLGKKVDKPKEEPMKKPEPSQHTLEPKSVEESPPPEEELKKEEVFATKPVEEAPDVQEKVEYSKEKKIDLSDIFNVNK